MLRRIARTSLSAFTRLPAVIALNSAKPAFCFASEVDNFSKLKTALQSEIKHEEENKEDISEYVNFFQNQGWKISYDGIQVELAKKTGVHNLRILFNARSPAVDDQP